MTKTNFEFTPSEYQNKFFDWVQHGVGNAVIEAYAGTGKTRTVVSAMNLIPKDQKCLYIAFNKSIADELNRKLRNIPNATARTMHSLGYLMLRRNLDSSPEIDEYKYSNYVKKNIADLTTTDGEIRTNKQIKEYINNIIMLLDYSRFNLAQSEREINNVAIKYSIPVSCDECTVVRKCLKWGKEHLESVDYTDMIWLPVELSMRPIGLQYDWVILDECQDTSLMAIQMFLKCIKRGGRFVAVGDRKQAIYFFSGASTEAFNFMVNYPNTTLFKLPITYRCPKCIVKLANNYVDNMIPRENAIEGKILNCVYIREIPDDSMVLSRTKAPLVKLYNKLLKRGVFCYIKGQDIGKKLIEDLLPIDFEELNSNLTKDGVFVRLFDDLFADRNKLIETRGIDYDDATLSLQIMQKYDNINSLLLLADKCKTKSQLIEKINDIFKDESTGICLSTIHKAKGLEADNVYILCHSSMPSKTAKLDWEIEQEKNLMYVAYTRTKNILGFVSEREIKPFGMSNNPTEIINDLANIERRVCSVLNKQPMQRLESVDLARFKLQKATKIEQTNKIVPIDLNKNENTDNQDLINELEELLN